MNEEQLANSSIQSAIIPPEIKEFIALLLSEKGGDDLPPEIQARALADLHSRFADYLLVNITKAMSEEQQDEFEALATGGASAEDVTEFIKSKVDMAKIVRETCEEFKSTFLGDNK